MELTPETFIAGAAVLGAAMKIIGRLADGLLDKIQPPKDTVVRFSQQFEERFASIFEKVGAIDMASRHNERTADSIADLGRKFEDHDRSDIAVFAQIKLNQNSALEKLDSISEEFRDHDRRVMEAILLQKSISDKLGK